MESGNLNTESPHFRAIKITAENGCFNNIPFTAILYPSEITKQPDDIWNALSKERVGGGGLTTNPQLPGNSFCVPLFNTVWSNTRKRTPFLMPRKWAWEETMRLQKVSTFLSKTPFPGVWEGGQAQADRVILRVLCPWLFFPGNPTESAQSGGAELVSAKTDSGGRTGLSVSFPAREDGGGEGRRRTDRGAWTPVSSRFSQFSASNSTKRDRRTDHLLENDRTESATFRQETLPSANFGARGNFWRAAWTQFLIRGSPGLRRQPSFPRAALYPSLASAPAPSPDAARASPTARCSPRGDGNNAGSRPGCAARRSLPSRRAGHRTTALDSSGAASGLREGICRQDDSATSKARRLARRSAASSTWSPGRAGRRARSFGRLLAGCRALTEGGEAPRQSRSNTMTPYPFLNSLFACKSLLISAAYLYLPGGASLCGDTRRPERGKPGEKPLLQKGRGDSSFLSKNTQMSFSFAEADLLEIVRGRLWKNSWENPGWPVIMGVPI